jgi:phenylalanyl-tRNA synthetase beta chain
VELDGQAAGVAGQVARTILQAGDLGEDVWFAELSLDALLGARRAAGPVVAPSAFPPVKRDLSILVSEAMLFESVSAVIRQTAGPQAARVELIDRFTKGAQVPPGRYSLTFSIEYRDALRTLTAAEADALHQRITQALVSRCGATLR